jgi:hypothetical protein
MQLFTKKAGKYRIIANKDNKLLNWEICIVMLEEGMLRKLFIEGGIY